jgi:tripartite-type tricarboxylate transporter receptor subunit TctC
MRTEWIGRAAAALAALIAVSSPAASQSVQDFYKGKQIVIIVGTGAGQDYDIWARLIGRHMGRHVPANPTFIVQNMPGAGHLTATNHLFNLAAKDGTVLGMVSRNMPNQAALKLPNVRYDPVKFHWIGSPELTNRACFAMSGASVKTAQQLLEQELIVGAVGAGQAITTTPILLKNLLGMKFKVVEGYAKPDDVVLAMERGEVQGMCETVTAFDQTRRNWIATGKIRLLFNMEQQPVPGLDAPSIYQFVKTDEQRRILGFYSASIELGRPMLAPPDVPADRVHALRRAFDATMADAAFLEEAKTMGLSVTPRKGEDLDAVVKGVMETPPDLIEKAEAMTRR